MFLQECFSGSPSAWSVWHSPGGEKWGLWKQILQKLQGNQNASATMTFGASPAEKDQLQVCGYGRRKSFTPELRSP